MDFRDRTLVRLADPEQRDRLFDQRSLENLVAAGYETAAGVTGPYRADFAELRLGVRLERPVTAEGGWSAPGGARQEGRFTLTGLGGPTADALWRGGVTVRTAAGGGRVDAVDAAPLAPAEGPELTVRYAPAAGTPRPVVLPVLVALLVRESVRPADLLAESRGLAGALGALGTAAVLGTGPGTVPLAPRGRAQVGWLVPPAVFDDPDWPGGSTAAGPAEQRAARAAAAGRLLAAQGIALLVVPEAAAA
ncbi:hypothetical protein [Kitasatospora sp. NPDC001527]|uniref:hypothetical protein n=1 Tax=Kitasatospora sp. NPDC001527 TaxID=3154519 RepID=UPI0033349E1A